VCTESPKRLRCFNRADAICAGISVIGTRNRRETRGLRCGIGPFRFGIDTCQNATFERGLPSRSLVETH
jgi:hypothetical protein